MYNFLKDVQDVGEIYDGIPAVYQLNPKFVSDCLKDDDLRKLFELSDTSINNQCFILGSSTNEKEYLFSIKNKDPYVIAESENNKKVDNNDLKITISVDTVLCIFRIYIALNFQNKKYSIKEILQVLKKQENMLTGNLCINGRIFYNNSEENIISDYNLNFIKKRINWWEEIQQIEPKLDELKIKMPLSKDTYSKLNQLYEGLVQGRDRKKIVNIKRLSFEVNQTIDTEQLKKDINEGLPLMMIKPIDLSSVGIHKKAVISTVFSNLDVKDCKQDDITKRVNVMLKDRPVAYSVESERIFPSLESAKSYQIETLHKWQKEKAGKMDMDNHF